MRLINLAGRLYVTDGSQGVDVAKASRGTFDADPQRVYARWAEFSDWAGSLNPATDGQPLPDDPALLGPPVPSPAQVFAVGLNYREHAEEAGFVRPAEPVVFTKFASSISGPVSAVALPTDSVDWEVELVVVLGRGGRAISAEKAWDHVAGVCVGQDLSERARQHAGPAPQFSLAKSHKGFSPIGPALVTPDELPDPDDLEICASINGERVQHARTSQMIFPVPELIARLSAVVELLPGDVIFTGTPAGVGAGRVPPRYLAAGDVLRSSIEGVGELRQTFVSSISTGTADNAPEESPCRCTD